MTQRLLTQDRVSAVVGPSLTPTTLAAYQLAAPHGLPMITTGGSRVFASPIRKWLFVSTENQWFGGCDQEGLYVRS